MDCHRSIVKPPWGEGWGTKSLASKYLRGKLHQQHYTTGTDDIKTALVLVSVMACFGLSMSAGQLYIGNPS